MSFNTADRKEVLYTQEEGIRVKVENYEKNRIRHEIDF